MKVGFFLVEVDFGSTSRCWKELGVEIGLLERVEIV